MYRVLAVIAQIGFWASLTWHFMQLTDRPVPQSIATALFLGIFVVWLPTVLQLVTLNGGRRTASWEAFKPVLKEAPVWMLTVAAGSFVYAMINFFVVTDQISGRVMQDDPRFGDVASGHALPFYAVAMVVLSFAARRSLAGVTRLCSQGHAVDAAEIRCAKCGAPVDSVQLPAGV